MSSLDDCSIRDTWAGIAASEVPVQLRHSLMIQKCNHDAWRCLATAAQSPYGMPPTPTCFELIQQCEKRFDDLLQSVKNEISFSNRFDLLGSLLYVQCCHFLYDDFHSLRIPGVLRAYSTASLLVSTILSDERSHKFMPYAPLRFSRMLFNAALVIFRVLHSTSAPGLDYNHGRLLFNVAAFSLQQLSVREKGKDQPLRASEMLRAFWRAGERSMSMCNFDLKLRVKSRLGASLTYDCLLLFRNRLSTKNIAINDVIGTGVAAGSISNSNTNGIEGGVVGRPDSIGKDHFTQQQQQFGMQNLPGARYNNTAGVLPSGIVDRSIPSDMLDLSPQLDMTNMLWLEEIGYPDLFDVHQQQIG